MHCILIGGGPFTDSDEFLRYLENTDPCFGSFKQGDPECKQCLAPILADGELHFLNDFCQARTRGLPFPKGLNVMSSKEIVDRLAQGQTVQEVYLEFLNGCDITTFGRKARELMAVRLQHAQSSYEITLPPLPKLKELRASVSNSQEH